MSDIHTQFEVHSESLDGDTNDQPDMEIWSAALPYVPGLVLDAIRREPHRHGPWIERIEGSIALADISGFTPMAERLAQAGKEGAEWLTDIMNRYFGRMLHISRGHGCCNTRFAGDALILTFMGSGHATRAIAAASAMQRATSRFTTFRAGEHRVRLKMTAGVHSGLFWSAVAGLPELRMQHFILGREASGVAEIQAAATTGELLITSAALDRAGELCVTEPCVNGYRVLRLSKRVVPQRRVEEEVPPPCSPLDLLAYVPPPIAMAMRSGRQARTIAGEHRKVTIAFINCLGVTELLEQQGAEALLDELQRYLSCVLRLSDQYGGFLLDNDIHTDGIKLIVVFGAPVAHEQDSANALRFALELARELPQLKLHFSHRIGINSGFVFSADVGAPYARKYTVMGDAVNLAARLMSSGAVNQILVSSRVMAEAGPIFVGEELAPIRVKGKRDPVRVCLLKGERSVVPTVTAQPSSPLVGRQAEMEAFQRACREVENGVGRAIVLSGEPGIGKSRLVMEMRNQCDGQGWAIHQGTCYPHTAGKPFAPWIQLLDSYFDICAADAPEARTKKVMGTIGNCRRDLQEKASLLNPLLDAFIPQSEVTLSLDEETRRRHLFELITELLQAAAVSAPLLLILEDLHWADVSSLQLLNHVGASLAFSPFLLCLTHRPRADLQLDLPQVSSLTIALAELSQSAATDLVRTILGQPQLDAQIAGVILSKAQGNPLFLQETAQSMRQSGVLDSMLSTPFFRLTEEIEGLDIPDRLQTLIMSRIDSLNPTTKEILCAASVVGLAFDIHSLQPLVKVDRDIHLPGQLQELVRLGLADRKHEARGPAYQFKHGLIQEVAYDSLPFARRRELHYLVASCIEHDHSRHLEPMYDVLVHHYSHSTNGEKTRFYALKAGAKARQVFAHSEAIEYYRRGLATLGEKGVSLADQRSYFLERIGDSYEASGHYGKAAAAYSQALRHWRIAVRRPAASAGASADLIDGLVTGARESSLCHKTAVACERRSDYDSALGWLESASRVLPPRQPLQAAKINITKSWVLYRKGLYEEAIGCGRLGLRVARRTVNRHAVAYANEVLAASNIEIGRLRRAIRYRQSALRIYNELEDLRGQSRAHNNLGVCYHALGNRGKALEHYTASLHIDERIGNAIEAAISHNNIGEELLARGQADLAITHFNSVVDTYNREGDPLGAAGLALVNLSRAHQRRRDYKMAFESLKQGTALLRKAGARSTLLEAVLQEAELLLEVDLIGSALRKCHQGLKAARELGTKPMEVRGLRVLGRIQFAHGDYGQAKVSIQHSAELAHRINAKYERGLALLCLAKLYSRQMQTRGSRRACRSLLREAETIFRLAGAEADLAEVLQLQNDPRSSR